LVRGPTFGSRPSPPQNFFLSPGKHPTMAIFRLLGSLCLLLFTTLFVMQVPASGLLSRLTVQTSRHAHPPLLYILPNFFSLFWQTHCNWFLFFLRPLPHPFQPLAMDGPVWPRLLVPVSSEFFSECWVSGPHFF